MWNVVLLRNGNYTIQNHSFGSYASCQRVVKPVAGGNIVGADYKQQWKITEAAMKEPENLNLYVISPTTNGYVCWYLVDQESGTPITVQSYSRSGKTQWEFTRVEDGEDTDSSEDTDGDEDTDGEGPTGTVNDTPSTSVPVKPAPLAPTRLAIPGAYRIRIAGTNKYLGWVDDGEMPAQGCDLEDAQNWAIYNHSRGYFYMIEANLADSDYFSIVRDGEGHLDDLPHAISLTPEGGPNEFRITQVDNGKSWAGLVFEDPS